MDEDLIIIIEKILNNYRRQMSKAGKKLDAKANITRRTAIELIGFFDDKRQKSIEQSEQHEQKALHTDDDNNLICPIHKTKLYKHSNGLAYCSFCDYSIQWKI